MLVGKLIHDCFFRAQAFKLFTLCLIFLTVTVRGSPMCKRSSGESEVTESFAQAFCMQWNAMQPDAETSCEQSIHSKYRIRAEWPIRPELIPGFQLTLCAFGYSSRLPLLIGCLYSWVKREKMEQKFFSKKKIRRQGLNELNLDLLIGSAG